MSTLTATRPARKPRSKPARSICWLSRPTAERIGSLQITTGPMTVGYWCRRLPSDFGSAFELTNWLNDETYAVCIDNQTGHHSCECLGFLRHGHCKHVSGLLALTGHPS
jgi:hypothetical protein